MGDRGVIPVPLTAPQATADTLVEQFVGPLQMGKKAAKGGAASAGGIEQRWSKPVADAGWTAVPNVLLDKQATIGLSPMDLNIVLQIAKFWWNADAPYPSIETVAAAIGVTSRTVQRHISRMEKSGLLERQERFYAKGGQKTNTYTFEGLIKRCKPFAKEITKARASRKAAERARIRRDKPMNRGRG